MFVPSAGSLISNPLIYNPRQFSHFCPLQIADCYNGNRVFTIGLFVCKGTRLIDFACFPVFVMRGYCEVHNLILLYFSSHHALPLHKRDRAMPGIKCDGSQKANNKWDINIVVD